MPLTSNYLRSFHLLRIFDMPLNAALFSIGDNWAVIDDAIIMNSWEVCLTGAYGRHLTTAPPPEQVSGQEVQYNGNVSHFILQ
jgi:hypothetical protein